jgi:hypothetical protein
MKSTPMEEVRGRFVVLGVRRQRNFNGHEPTTNLVQWLF